MALSKSSLRDVVKPNKLDEFEVGLTGLCDDRYNPVGNRWFPRECCDKHAKFDKRVPGLFKTEYEGQEMIGLCSKTYVVSKTVASRSSSAVLTAARLLRRARRQGPKRLDVRPLVRRECKFSSKGVAKRLVKNPLSIFKGVMRTRKPVSGLNKGFRTRNHRIYTYEQMRCGFSYFYCKRRVLDDGVHTVPLDITLCPVRSKSRSDESSGDFIDTISYEQLADLLNCEDSN